MQIKMPRTRKRNVFSSSILDKKIPTRIPKIIEGNRKADSIRIFEDTPVMTVYKAAFTP